MVNNERLPIRYAVVAGINNYSGSPMSSLNFCSNDAEAFYEALLHYAQYNSSNIFLFSDGNHPAAHVPTYSDILSAVNEICEKANEEDSILLFFAGHGTRDERDSYLLTKEYRKNVLADSSIAMSKVNNYFQQSKAKFKLRFFDACHSGRLGLRGMSNPNVDEHLAITAEGWATLASCREDQFAHENNDIKQGIFSYFIVRGLSGDASIDGSRITLDNLKVYVMDNTIDLSKKLGLEQTPVFSGEQAGSLVLAGIERKEEHLPETLLKIEKTEPTQLEPAADDSGALLSSLKAKLVTRSDTFIFVVPSQEKKLELAASLTEQMFSWAKNKTEKDNHSLSNNLFSTERISIEQSPLNRRTAEYLNNSKARNILEFEYKYETVTKIRQVPVRESYGYGIGREVTRYVKEEYEDGVVAGIKESGGYAESTIIIKFRPEERVFPYCCMSISIIPCTFGLYAFCYFASTNLVKEMKEQWASDSFSVKGFEAIPTREIQSFKLEDWLNNLYAQFTSFITESIDARQRLLVQLGAASGISLT
ncbi:MAG: hypothetical protein AUG51_12695 [Acidobacteria bacterium 13_1_20CM_3_53_8]|nr:MAG: hypothetical protein AUG51_12695 [Acidobacteria bacterium 13_1_20CM_3_53_8]